MLEHCNFFCFLWFCWVWQLKGTAIDLVRPKRDLLHQGHGHLSRSDTWPFLSLEVYVLEHCNLLFVSQVFWFWQLNGTWLYKIYVQCHWVAWPHYIPKVTDIFQGSRHVDLSYRSGKVTCLEHCIFSVSLMSKVTLWVVARSMWYCHSTSCHDRKT